MTEPLDPEQLSRFLQTTETLLQAQAENQTVLRALAQDFKSTKQGTSELVQTLAQLLYEQQTAAIERQTFEQKVRRSQRWLMGAVLVTLAVISGSIWNSLRLSALSRDRQQCTQALITEWDTAFADAIGLSGVNPTPESRQAGFDRIAGAGALLARAPELCYSPNPNPNPVNR